MSTQKNKEHDPVVFDPLQIHADDYFMPAGSMKHEGRVGICLLNIKYLTEIRSARHPSC